MGQKDAKWGQNCLSRNQLLQEKNLQIHSSRQNKQWLQGQEMRAWQLIEKWKVKGWRKGRNIQGLWVWADKFKFHICSYRGTYRAGVDGASVLLAWVITLNNSAGEKVPQNISYWLWFCTLLPCSGSLYRQAISLHDSRKLSKQLYLSTLKSNLGDQEADKKSQMENEGATEL